jgi:hypothetical protein
LAGLVALTENVAVMQTTRFVGFTQGHPNEGFPDGCHEDDLNRARLRVVELSAQLASAKEVLRKIEAARGIP